MKLKIANCNNIDSAVIEIEEGKLNIKYAINGTGKSSIAKAISLATEKAEEGKLNLADLVPFKHRKAGDNPPQVEGIENIASVKSFNDEYVNEFVFQPDELVKGSFEIFIKNKDYDEGITQIEKLVGDLRAALTKDEEISNLLKDFDELSGNFGKPVKQGLHGSSNLAKAFKSGNIIRNIPPGLEPYASFIQQQNAYKWIKWQHDGREYLDTHNSCPYCVTDITTKKKTIQKITDAYDPKSIDSLNKIVGAFERLNKYFSEDTKSTIDVFIRNTAKYSEDQINFLLAVKTEIDNLSSNLRRVQNLGFGSLKDVDKVVETLAAYKIDINLFPNLKSEETEAKLKVVNEGIDKLLEQAGQLQGTVAKHRGLIQRLVKEYRKEINDFLANAGYRYSVQLVEDSNNSYKLKLLHVDLEEAISTVKNHLSFGERNAIALVLFMFDALKANPSLIVLDDPISSFDKNKKYAIVDMLFRRKHSFKGKTVLMLTHDLDPVVDMLMHHSDRFDPPNVCFLENKHGQLTEIPVAKSDIRNFLEINQENVESSSSALNKLVYHRRFLEVTNSKGLDFDLLSNLLHKREKPTRNVDGVTREMTPLEISDASRLITTVLPDFKYEDLLALLKDNKKMKSLYAATASNYEKIHLYRIIFDDKKQQGVESDVILKFINEAFHVENNYIYQLNPKKYQLIPQFVIDECDRYVAASA